MKITVERSKFLKKLEEANNMVDSKSLIQNYKYLYIKTMKEKNIIVFRGINPTNQSVLTAFLDDVEISDDFVIGLNGTILEKIVKKMPEGKIDLELRKLKTKDKLIVTNDDLKLEMKTVSPDNIPSFDVKDDLNKVLILDREKLIESIKKIAFAVSTDEARPILCGINFSLFGEMLKMVSLDGYRLAMTSMTIGKNQTEGFDFTISNEFLKDAMKVLSKIEDKAVKFEFNERQLVVKTKYLKLQTTFLSGNFINFEQIVKDARGFETHATYDTKTMKSSLDRMAIIARQDNSALIFNVEKDKVKMKGTSKTAKSIEKVKAQTKLPSNVGDDGLKIGINVNYIQDVIKHIDSDTAKMQFQDSMKPIYFIDGNSEFMLLPVRITE